MNGRPSSVHVLAWFDCERCAGPMQRMGVAELLTDGRVNMHKPAELAGMSICNACIKADEQQRIEERRKHDARRRWLQKHQHAQPPKPPKPPRGRA